MSTKALTIWTFVVTSVAVFMVSLDNLVVTTALPVIKHDLGASLQGLEWTVNAYTLTFAVLLLTGAALGDRFGRKRMFLAGLAVFTLGSAAAALAPSIGWLIAARALQGVGGVVAIVQREMVEKKQWLTREEFVEDWAVAQILPGPNVVNLSLMIGDRYFGLRGALMALAGMLGIPLLLVLALAAILSNTTDIPGIQGALRGMGAVAAGLFTATGIRLIGALKSNVMGKLACTMLALATFVAVALLRVPLIWVLLIIGGLAFAWAYRQLRRVRAPQGAA